MINEVNLHRMEYDNESTLSSIAIDDTPIILNCDKNRENNLSIPLRGILKDSCDFSEEYNVFYTKIIKICIIIFLFIISIPIIFCDIYYGLIYKNCLNSKPYNLDISLKIYLLFSGFMGILLLVLASIIILLGSQFSDYCYKNLKNVSQFDLIHIKNFINKIKKMSKYLLGILSLVWNILGTFLFCGYYYENGICNIEISTYLFISLIIKLLVSIIYLSHKL